MLARHVPKSTATTIKGVRTFFAAKTSSQSALYAVDEQFPGVPETHASATRKASHIHASTTSSGLKLASEEGDNYVATLGVEIAAGSRTETDETVGLSQLFAKMAFRATDARSDLRLFRDIEAIGGVIRKAAGRDFVRYSISVLPDHVEAAAEILSETTLAPRLAHWDVAIQKEQVKLAAASIAACSEASVLENVHAAAFYDDATLGRPQVTAENLAALTEADLATFYEQYVNTSNLAVVGSGVTHATLTNIANEYFIGLSAGSATPKAKATYVGGESRVKKAGVKNTYVALAFPTAGAKDFGVAHVLKSLLTSRLNSKQAAGFLASYEDAGLVGLTGFAAPSEAGALVDTFVAEIKKIATAAPSTEELGAAKAAAGLAVVDTLASRQGKIEFLGAAAQSQTVATPLANVNAVTAQAVQQLAAKAIASRPALASVGKLSTVPRLDAVLANLK